LLDTAEADVLVCGHTHLPYHKVLPSGRHLINDGSVGKPKDGDPRARYAMLSYDEGANGDGLHVKFFRVLYDVERAAQAIESTDMPDEFARMLRTGTG
jgi:diadenosine tetraphosphatase ApaH/serine/threonine PP2A family protein phosphatase